jgi:hypothetical protein
MVPEEWAAAAVQRLIDGGAANLYDVAAAEKVVATRIRQAVDEEREACAQAAERQALYPGTQRVKRQQWVKAQIAAAIRARKS